MDKVVEKAIHYMRNKLCNNDEKCYKEALERIKKDKRFAWEVYINALVMVWTENVVKYNIRPRRRSR